MARPLGVNIISTFNSKGISRAISDFKKLGAAGASSGTKATFALRTLDKGITNSAKKIAKFGLIAGAAFGAVGFGLVKIAEAAKTSNSRIDQINKSMGLFGMQTQQVTDRLIKLAETQAMATGVDRNAIKETMAKLLTFKELAVTATEVGGAFDRATMAAIDLGAAGFGEASQNAVQLGKALNDPIKGITALARSGVTFTEQEKEKIKTLVESGKMLEAQDTLLKAIESQVGGTATATANASDKMKQGLGMAAEALGNLLLPAFQKLVDFINNKVVPYVQKFADLVGEKGLGAGLAMLSTGFLNVTTNMGTFGNVMLALTTAFVTLRLVSIAAAIAQTMFNVALLANPIGLTIAYFIAMGVILAGLYIKFAVVREAINMIGTALKFVFLNTIAAVQNYFIGFINLAIMGINVLIKAANFFGADLEEVGLLGFKAFTGIGNAAETAGKKINYTSAIVDAESKRFGALAGKVKVYGSAVVTTFSGVGKTVETAKEKLAKFVDQLDKYKSATRSVRDANKSAIKSDQDLADAKTKLADAQAYLNQITSGYGKESKQAKTAQRKVTDAERSAERSKYAIEEATFAVSDAEQDLIDVRADSESSVQDVREAEIALAEAKLSLKDSIDSEVDATDQLTEANLLLDEAINGVKEGSDAYKEAQDAIVKAQDGVLDAIDSQTSAYERQKDAIDALAKATEILNKVKADVPLADAKAAAAVAGVDLPKSAGYGSFLDAVRALHPNSTSLNSATPVTDSKNRFPKLFADYKAGNLVPLARGGIVTSPTAALIGESGAEAVIPLDKMNQGMTVNVTVNAGMGANANEIGNEIVNVLQRYNRMNGALPLKVS